MVDDNNKSGEGPRGKGKGKGRSSSGGAGGGGASPDYRNRIFEHTQEAKEEVQMLATSINELSQDMTSYVQEQVKARPWAVLGAAAGVGYLLGGGLASRITRTGLSFATRIGMGMLMRQFIENQGAAFAGGESSDVGDTGV